MIIFYYYNNYIIVSVMEHVPCNVYNYTCTRLKYSVNYTNTLITIVFCERKMNFGFVDVNHNERVKNLSCAVHVHVIVNQSRALCNAINYVL